MSLIGEVRDVLEVLFDTHAASDSRALWPAVGGISFDNLSVAESTGCLPQPTYPQSGSDGWALQVAEGGMSFDIFIHAEPSGCIFHPSLAYSESDGRGHQFTEGDLLFDIFFVNSLFFFGMLKG